MAPAIRIATTIDCCNAALQHGVALNVAGGTHHAFRDHGEGFTITHSGRWSYLDIGLADGTGDDAYLGRLQTELIGILEEFQPDFACFLLGVDVLSTDRFGKLALTLQGCATRDRMVLEALRSKSVPCAISMGGGYSPDIRTIITAHVNTFKTAIELFVE